VISIRLRSVFEAFHTLSADSVDFARLDKDGTASMLRRRACVLAAAIVGFVVSLHGETRGEMIFIANSSFEGPAYVTGTSGFGPAHSWAQQGIGGGAFRLGVNGINFVNSVPDGLQAGYAGNTGGPGALFQDLGVSAIAGATYSLDVFVGSPDYTNANYLVELIEGSNTIASASGTLLSTGSFIPINLTAQSVGNGSLGIRLSETNVGQSFFDNVRLSVTAVPEPSSLFMLSFGVAGLTGYGWRRRRSQRNEQRK
jgi:hypothetical protein